MRHRSGCDLSPHDEDERCRGSDGEASLADQETPAADRVAEPSQDNRGADREQASEPGEAARPERAVREALLANLAFRRLAAIVDRPVVPGERRGFDKLNLGLLENKGQWIYFPQNISILTSKNGKSWKGKIKTENVSRNTIINIGRETRYIKVVMESIGAIPDGEQGAGNIPWTFIDELFIR